MAAPAILDLTITEVKVIGSGKVKTVAGTFMKDGEVKKLPYPLKCWADAAFAEGLEAGKTVKVEIEQKPSTRNNAEPGEMEHWLLTVDGKPAKEAKRPGGGKAYTPKTPAEIHGPNIALIIANLGACEGLGPKEIKPYIDLYKAEVASFGTQTSGKAGAS